MPGRNCFNLAETVTAKSGMIYPEAMQQSRRDQQGAATLNESHWAQFP
jgi:hypothetical protein